MNGGTIREECAACLVCGAAALTAFGVIGTRAGRSSADEPSGVLPSGADGRTPDPAVER
ncbi:hypothetical protein KYY02_05240 [Streptomyces pimonensis]|uniref:Uncharacterized protein n=1 Tax=Streptomyces pimonensis TaxID=2860288 RepID=A0ABV4IXX6_9ACTN